MFGLVAGDRNVLSFRVVRNVVERCYGECNLCSLFGVCLLLHTVDVLPRILECFLPFRGLRNVYKAMTKFNEQIWRRV